MLPLLFYCYTRYQINTWNARVRGLCPIRTNLFFEYLLENLSFLDRQFAALLPLFFVRLVVIFLCFYLLLCVCLVFLISLRVVFSSFPLFFVSEQGRRPCTLQALKSLTKLLPILPNRYVSAYGRRPRRSLDRPLETASL